MQIGIDSFAAAISDPATGLTLSPVERMHHLLEEIAYLASLFTSTAHNVLFSRERQVEKR